MIKMRDLAAVAAIVLLSGCATAEKAADSPSDHAKRPSGEAKAADQEQNAAAAVANSAGKASIPAKPGDWPHFGGPNGDCSSPDTGINKDWKAKPPKEVWRVPMADGGFAGPCIVGDKLFINDHGNNCDYVRCLDVKTGKELWQSDKFPNSNYHSSGHSNSTPTFDGNKLYVMSRDGQLSCFDAEKGSIIWKHDLVAEFKGKPSPWLYNSSPVIDGNNVIVCPGGPDGCVAAFTKDKGELVWRGGRVDFADCSTPTLATLNGRRSLLVFGDQALMNLNPKDGKTQWEAESKVKTTHIPSPVIADGHVFASAGYGTPCVMVAADGKVLWENKNMMPHMNTPVYDKGYLYGTSGQSESTGDLVCVDAKTGAVIWKQPGFEAGGLVAVDGVLIVIDGKTGEAAMARINPKAYEELGRFKPVGGRSWTSPAIADGKLFVRNEKELACFDLK